MSTKRTVLRLHHRRTTFANVRSTGQRRHTRRVPLHQSTILRRSSARLYYSEAVQRDMRQKVRMRRVRTMRHIRLRIVSKAMHLHGHVFVL